MLEFFSVKREWMAKLVGERLGGLRILRIGSGIRFDNDNIGSVR
jgi:hypothetical protein